jgi:hypothetical protein
LVSYKKAKTQNEIENSTEIISPEEGGSNVGLEAVLY